MTTEETAIRLATVLSTAMNVAFTLNNESLLLTSNHAELRSTLLWLVEEMSWIRSSVVPEAASTISWPSDGQERIDRLRAVASAWDPVGPPPSEVLSCARDFLGMLVPS